MGFKTLASFQLLPNLERALSPLIPNSWNKSEMFYVCAQSHVKYRVPWALQGGPGVPGMTTLHTEEIAWGESGLSKVSAKAAQCGEAAEQQEAELVQNLQDTGPYHFTCENWQLPVIPCLAGGVRADQQSKTASSGTQSAWEWSSTFLVLLFKPREYSDFSSSSLRYSVSEF